MVLDGRAAIGIGPRYVGISCVVLTVHSKSAGVLLCIRCLIPWSWKGGDCIGLWYVGISLIVDARSLNSDHERVDWMSHEHSMSDRQRR
jgi:hypothetical protein